MKLPEAICRLKALRSFATRSHTVHIYTADGEACKPSAVYARVLECGGPSDGVLLLARNHRIGLRLP